MQIITKNIRWRALVETYQTAKFDRSPNNLSWDIALTDRCPEQKKKEKRIRKAKTIDLHLMKGLYRGKQLATHKIVMLVTVYFTPAANSCQIIWYFVRYFVSVDSTDVRLGLLTLSICQSFIAVYINHVSRYRILKFGISWKWLVYGEKNVKNWAPVSESIPIWNTYHFDYEFAVIQSALYKISLVRFFQMLLIPHFLSDFNHTLW